LCGNCIFEVGFCQISSERFAEEKVGGVVEQNCSCRKKISSELPKRIEKKKNKERRIGDSSLRKL
jgi:hypothetical protein